jgi:flagellar biogenesis protein FliO
VSVPTDVESQPIGAGAAAQNSDASTPVDWLSTLRLVGSLAAVIGLVAATVWALRRFAPRAVRSYSSESLKLLARTYIGPKQTVCLLKAPGKLLVVGATQEAVSLLAEITDPAQIERILGEAEAASSKGASAAFRDLLSGVTGNRRRGRAAEEELAAAVSNVSTRFADLTRRLDQRR